MQLAALVMVRQGAERQLTVPTRGLGPPNEGLKGPSTVFQPN